MFCYFSPFKGQSESLTSVKTEKEKKKERKKKKKRKLCQRRCVTTSVPNIMFRLEF